MGRWALKCIHCWDRENFSHYLLNWLKRFPQICICQKQLPQPLSISIDQHKETISKPKIWFRSSIICIIQKQIIRIITVYFWSVFLKGFFKNLDHAVKYASLGFYCIVYKHYWACLFVYFYWFSFSLQFQVTFCLVHLGCSSPNLYVLQQLWTFYKLSYKLLTVLGLLKICITSKAGRVKVLAPNVQAFIFTTHTVLSYVEINLIEYSFPQSFHLLPYL